MQVLDASRVLDLLTLTDEGLDHLHQHLGVRLQDGEVHLPAAAVAALRELGGALGRPPQLIDKVGEGARTLLAAEGEELLPRLAVGTGPLEGGSLADRRCRWRSVVGLCP